MWLNGFSVIQLKEIVKAKDPVLSSTLLKLSKGIVNEEVASLLKSRLRHINVASANLHCHYMFQA